ncbi:hypothetical protein [Mycobacterium xenopi]|uniref:Uncharacterized protein n=1 Tax=Mycobacterium xenopi TaxID=1789 RepID=A0AAD1H0S2_MYCXE|nr:hypothetical protein [Mycobacterium xenopi]ORX21618.1 hypothetical protein AWC32_21650 [Mycobacterium xenopi]BBU22140.1 hypothetical protein MYXE_19300 [Mycobacterium xenopi]SPX77978.1 Uncharacterised protein [Mycobacterium xenopi]
MITAEDVLDALTKAAAYDTSHTPRTSQMLIAAWVEHFNRYAPAVQREDLLAAVSEYHREPRNRMLQPADLSAIARALRRDNTSDEPPPAPPAAETADYPPHWTARQRIDAYWTALRNHATPASQDEWENLLKQAANQEHANDSAA